MGNKKIALDFDDTLCEFMSPFLEFHNSTYGTDLQYDKIGNFHLEKTLGIERNDLVDRLDAFYETNMLDKANPIKDAINSVKMLGTNYDLCILTCRPARLNHTMKFIDRYIHNQIHIVHFANDYENNPNCELKHEICVKKNIDYIVDDSLDFAVKCSPHVDFSFVIETPWNVKGSAWDKDLEGKIPDNVVRCKDWKEILSYF